MLKAITQRRLFHFSPLLLKTKIFFHDMLSRPLWSTLILNSAWIMVLRQACSSMYNTCSQAWYYNTLIIQSNFRAVSFHIANEPWNISVNNWKIANLKKYHWMMQYKSTTQYSKKPYWMELIKLVNLPRTRFWPSYLKSQ